MKVPRLFFRVAAFSFLLVSSADALQSEKPDYMEADRAFVEGQFGVEATDYIFSDSLTQDRRGFIARSLQRIPAQACPDNPPFTVLRVWPLISNTAGLAWVERYEVECAPKVRRTALVVARKDTTITMQEVLPGDTLTDIKLQRDAARDITATASRKRAADCQEIPKLMDTRVLENVYETPPKWRELWIYRVCNKTVEVDVRFEVGPEGRAVWAPEAR